MSGQLVLYLGCLSLTLPVCLGTPLDLPARPGLVYSRLQYNASIPCGLTFPPDEPLELLMWYKNLDYITYLGKEGVKHRDPSLMGKYDILTQDYTLAITATVTEDTGNYTCVKSVKRTVNGSLSIVEVNKTSELIVQDLDNATAIDNVTALLPVDSVTALLPIDNVTVSDNATVIDHVTVLDNATVIDNVTVLDNVTDWDSVLDFGNVTELGNMTWAELDLPGYIATDYNTTSSDGLRKRWQLPEYLKYFMPDVPSPPGLPAIPSVGSRNASVSWRKSLADNNSPITHYIINIRTVPQQGFSAGRALLVDADTTAILIRDLRPHTPYQVQVIAKNALGNSTPSSPSRIFLTEPEPPSSPPLNLEAVNVNSQTVHLTWDPPPPGTWNGSPEGYILQYGVADELAGVYALAISDSTTMEYTLKGLRPYTEYIITLKATNDMDYGPPATFRTRTAEGVPDKPIITHYAEQKSTSFVVFWMAPKNENGILKNYQLQWVYNNTYKTRIITGHLTNPMSAHISGLKPYTTYNLSVRAETHGGFSEFSDYFLALTDVTGPSVPRILNCTVLSSTMVYLHWTRPAKFYRDISSYIIHFVSTSTDNIRGERMVDGKDLKTILEDLRTNNAYRLKIAGITNSYFSFHAQSQSKSYYVGDFSEEVEFMLEDDGSLGSDPTVLGSEVLQTVNAGVVAGIVLCAFILVVAMLLFVSYRSMTCRKYYRDAFYYFAVPTSSMSPQTVVVPPPDPIDKPTKYDDIPVDQFLQHIRALHMDSDNGFSNEFEDITSLTRTDLLAEASYAPENKIKNRYVNINAFDHSRVLLQQVPGRPKSSDYINGNYIDGYNKPHGYIATQGPLPQTFADYWRMVWEQGSIVIVMITNLVERGRHKCDLYWPEEGAETYGSITVKHINTFSRAHYTVRMFSLKSSKLKKKHVSERIVYQYHYTEWPDHGVPDFTLPVLKFVQKSAWENPPGAGPIVIHCSAGVGRTGTYILIETMIKQIKDKGTVNIANFLLHIRNQRNFLVQTEEQYMLVHDVIAEYLLTQGDTEVRDITQYMDSLTYQVDGTPTALDLQYSLVTSYSPKPEEMFHALKSVNLAKNRCLDLIPQTVKRVLLPMKPGQEGSDYINATYLQGYTRSNEFIVTQHPLVQTVEDFWRMVWDQNSSVIVLLSDIDDDEFKCFWPEKSKPTAVDTGNFKLTYREDDERKKYMTRELLLESTQDDYILMTKIVSPKDTWPDSCSPPHTVFDLVETVQEMHRQNDIGPVIVIDCYGGVQAATFCALWSLYDQLQHDKVINVYMLTKLYHLKRAGIIGTKEDYMYLYTAAESLARDWGDRDKGKQASPGSIRLNLGSIKRNGTLPRSVTISSKIETDV